ncbi:F-box/kelch-repeat protein [Raphanus sativus]|uniref:F-box/kelch-repeat protein At4g19870-like n=1 Tax=Raphanus sativus TaxID=3726 RepID=A0A6J0KRX3_RAPSA|nr:F-box/kelch-repeat protein At4g19870-like [Raphanus sativus]XP_018449801.1 F-box/kelch-repeat protein At4g19870-like [Raphanus sativus]KAJ4880970.1 F-box/kelch-repeat protein [Raphanus sativus]
MNRQEEPPEKTRKTSEPPSCPSFSLLPDEIVVDCLARISRAYYWRLSIISKSFRSLVSSKELYAARARIGNTEQCLYVCLSDDKSPQWYTLWINPNRTLTVPAIKKNKKTLELGYSSLAPIPSSDFPSVSESTLVVGSEIYVIGGPTKTVRILDCRTHTWRDAPSMTIARRDALTCLYDGKIYVMGGCGVLEEPWAEVFDTNTQTWEPLSDPGTEIRNIGSCAFCKIKEIKGKIYFWNSNRRYAYDASQDNWESFADFWESRTCLIDGAVQYYYIPNSACEIDGVWYSITRRPNFRVRNPTLINSLWLMWSKDGVDWEVVKGLYSLREMHKRNGGSSRNTTKLVSCGGKLLLLWEGYMKHNPSNRKKIWCAEITLKTDGGRDVWGNVKWINVVRSVPTQCELLHCLVVSV